MKRGTHRHPKLYKLCELLKVRRPTALGYLELLWEFTRDFAPQGDVGRFPDKSIEAALDWSGKAGKLVSSLVEAGWIDRHPKWRLLVHDWHDHAEDSVRKRLKRNSLDFLTYREKLTGQSTVTDRTMSATQSENGGLPLPRPMPKPRPEPEPKPEPPFSTRTPPNVREFRSAQHNAAKIPPEYESFDFATWIEGRWKKHPIPGRLQLAQQYAAERIFQPDGFRPDDFDRAHNAWCEYWATGDSPPCKLEVFIADGWWRKTPPAVKARDRPTPPPFRSTMDSETARRIAEARRAGGIHDET